MSLKAVVANRIHDEWLAVSPRAIDPARLTERLTSVLQGPVADRRHVEWLVKNFLSYQHIAREEAARLTQFAETLPTATPVVRVPALPAFPADLAGLAKMHRYLFT